MSYIPREYDDSLFIEWLYQSGRLSPNIIITRVYEGSRNYGPVILRPQGLRRNVGCVDLHSQIMGRGILYFLLRIKTFSCHINANGIFGFPKIYLISVKDMINDRFISYSIAKRCLSNIHGIWYYLEMLVRLVFDMHLWIDLGT